MPAIDLSKDPKNESFFFIADLHSLTTLKDGPTRMTNTQAVAAAWIACGFDTEKNVFYRQSRVLEVCQLAWYLNCFSPYPMLANAHSFKDKSENLADVNAGLFTYPVLMAADILLYDANIVPVGKDQKQHLEITRDLAAALNHRYGDDTFVLPEARISQTTPTIPGTDGRKMSKSYDNFLDVFLPEKALKKQVMGIVTDSTPLDSPKDPETCHVFAIYRLLATETEVEEMRQKYLAGGYGYGHAKKELFGLLLDRFAKERAQFQHLIQHPEELEERLQAGEAKARQVARQVLERVSQRLGFA